MSDQPSRRDLLLGLGATSLASAAAGQALAGHGAASQQGDEKPAVEHLSAYLCAYHIGKANPKFIVEAHHFCSPVHDELHQCVIFDKRGKGARLLGVEYIISDRIYRSLSRQEQKYYHPHTYEVTAGLLIAPDMPPEEETKFLEGLATTWGKTWHTWPDPKTELPLGDPMLMWAVTGDGQLPDGLLAARDAEWNVSTEELKKRRAHIGPIPQIPSPTSIDELGRQWTTEGPDRPSR